MPVAALPVPTTAPAATRVPAPRRRAGTPARTASRTPVVSSAKPSPAALAGTVTGGASTRGAARPPRRYGGFVGALNREWEQLAASPAAARGLDDWRRQHPQLLGDLSALGDLEEHARGTLLVDASARRARRDEVLNALVQLAHTGDQLAVRAITQLLLGDLVAMGRRLRRTYGASTDDVHVDLVGWLVLVIPTCPTDHPEGTATRLTLDTLKRLTRDQKSRPHEVPLTEDHESLPSPGTSATDLPLTEVLAWAVRSHVVTVTEATWLVQLADQGPHGRDLQGLAHDVGVSYLAMRKRVSRLKQRLADHVRSIVETPVDHLQGMWELEPNPAAAEAPAPALRAA